MRTTVTLDDDLVLKAERYVGKMERSALVNYALKRLIQSEAARRLAAMGGSCPDLEDVPRRRPDPDGVWRSD